MAGTDSIKFANFLGASSDLNYAYKDDLYQVVSKEQMSNDQLQALATISSNSFLSQLPKKVLVKIAKRCRLKRVAARHYVFHEGQSATHCYFVYTGRVAILKSSASGHQLIYSLLSSGHTFAITPVLEKRDYPVSARCESRTTLFSLAQSDAIELSKEHPEIRSAALSLVGHQMYRVLELSRSLAHDSVEVRMASILLSLAPQNTRLNSYKLDLLRRELAELSGVSVETASRTCKKLEKTGLIDTSIHGQIFIRNRSALRDLVTDPD